MPGWSLAVGRSDVARIEARKREPGSDNLLLASLRQLTPEVSFLTVTEPFHVFTFNADQIEDTRPEFKRHMEARAEHTLAAAGEVAAAAGISFDTIQREGEQPYEIIIDIAEARRCDLIVMASHGRRGVSAMLLGSETMKVLTHTTRPVLVVR